MTQFAVIGPWVENNAMTAYLKEVSGRQSGFLYSTAKYRETLEALCKSVPFVGCKWKVSSVSVQMYVLVGILTAVNGSTESVAKHEQEIKYLEEQLSGLITNFTTQKTQLQVQEEQAEAAYIQSKEQYEHESSHGTAIDLYSSLATLYGVRAQQANATRELAENEKKVKVEIEGAKKDWEILLITEARKEQEAQFQNALTITLSLNTADGNILLTPTKAIPIVKVNALKEQYSAATKQGIYKAVYLINYTDVIQITNPLEIDPSQQLSAQITFTRPERLENTVIPGTFAEYEGVITQFHVNYDNERMPVGKTIPMRGA